MPKPPPRTNPSNKNIYDALLDIYDINEQLSLAVQELAQAVETFNTNELIKLNNITTITQEARDRLYQQKTTHFNPRRGTKIQMLLAFDYGHNTPPDIGCSGLHPKYPREDELTKELTQLIVANLQQRGYDTAIVTPPWVNSVGHSLRQRVAIANGLQADYFFSVHFNCFNKKAHGTEQYAISDKGKRMARAIQQGLVKKFGFADRGVKDGSRLYVVRHTNMPAVLLEVCFCDSERDMAVYNAKDAADVIANEIDFVIKSS